MMKHYSNTDNPIDFPKMENKMNERIQELFNIATEYTQSQDTGNISQVKLNNICAEKFAQLIVRECLNIVEPDEDSGDEWCVTLKGAAQEIKEHFGVEE